jgi:hypothetical protein
VSGEEEVDCRYAHQYEITGLIFSSWAARKAKREMSAVFSLAGNGVAMVGATRGTGDARRAEEIAK